MAKKRDMPNRLHTSTLRVLDDSREVNGVGIALLVLETDDGPIELAINKAGAEILWVLLDTFLDPDEPL